jgi:hypothetical protein
MNDKTRDTIQNFINEYHKHIDQNEHLTEQLVELLQSMAIVNASDDLPITTQAMEDVITIAKIGQVLKSLNFTRIFTPGLSVINAFWVTYDSTGKRTGIYVRLSGMDADTRILVVGLRSTKIMFVHDPQQTMVFLPDTEEQYGTMTYVKDWLTKHITTFNNILKGE